MCVGGGTASESTNQKTAPPPKNRVSILVEHEALGTLCTRYGLFLLYGWRVDLNK